MSTASFFLILTCFGLINATPLSVTTTTTTTTSTTTTPHPLAVTIAASIHRNNCPSNQVWNNFDKICTKGSQFPNTDSNKPFDYDIRSSEEQKDNFKR